jgi:hypothetical protein
MDKSEKFTFSFTLVLVVVIIAACLIIFMLTPSPVSPTKVLFGYITGVYTKNKSVYLDFDPARWLKDTNTEFPASIACAMDNICSGCSLPITKSCVPDGYYIQNSDPKVTSYPLASFTKIGTLLLDPDWDEINPGSKPYKTITPSQLQNIFQDPKSPDNWISKTPFNITVVGGNIIIINQHYIP